MTEQEQDDCDPSTRIGCPVKFWSRNEKLEAVFPGISPSDRIEESGRMLRPLAEAIAALTEP